MSSPPDDVDLSRVWIEGEVFEPDLPAVKLGQQVSAEFPALPGDVRSGRIAYVYPTLNPETRTARVRVELANPDLRLKPGMYATFRFATQTVGPARRAIRSWPLSATGASLGARSTPGSPRTTRSSRTCCGSRRGCSRGLRARPSRCS